MPMVLINMKEFKKSKNSIAEIEGVGDEISSLLSSMDIEVVSDLLEADMDDILKNSQISENILDSVYEAVQNFVEEVKKTLSIKMKTGR